MSRYQTNHLAAFDIEVYPNFFLAGFMMPNQEYYQYTDPDLIDNALKYLLSIDCKPVGFNSLGYDDPVTSIFLKDRNEKDAYNNSCSLINGHMNYWDVDNTVGSIDLMPLIKDRMSLKQVAARIGHPLLQELPINPHKELDDEEKQVIVKYNQNDLQITMKLAYELRDQLQLRTDLSEQYNIDLRSKGDAQIAEQVISSEIYKVSGITKSAMKNEARKIIMPNATVTVQQPSWWDSFRSTSISNNYSHLRYIMDDQQKRFNVPIPLDENGRMKKGSLFGTVYLDDAYYRNGVGGLHSVDGSGCHWAGDGEILMDIDVESYYPRISLNEELFPRHMKDYFGPIYERIVNQRVTAKRAGDKVTADSLKITINGTFGKSSDPYSSMYDPKVTAGITVTGQVALLILIAMLADNGIHTVSANTDGITAKFRQKDLDTMKEVVGTWEYITKFKMEYTEYKSTYSLDVNNYCAMYNTGGIKAKGRFVSPEEGKHDLGHSVNFNIVADAVKHNLIDRSPVDITIKRCTDINKFALTQAVTGNWKTEWKGQELGKLVRFYKSTSPDAASIIRIPGAGVKGKQGDVANSESCIPIQNLPESFPGDVDYHWYIDKAQEWLSDMRRSKRSGMNQIANDLYKLGLNPAIVPVNPDESPSRKFYEIGDMDWNSLKQDETIGICTGKKVGLVAVVDKENMEAIHLFRFKGKLPSRTRETMNKRSGMINIYGQNVRITKWFGSGREIMDMNDDMLRIWYETFYLPSELKKIGVIIDD